MQNRATFDDFNINEADAKKFIRLGIKGELQFEVMNYQNSYYQPLNERQLHEIYSSHPIKKPIRLTNSSYNSGTGYYDSFCYEQLINYDDLWFDDSKFAVILQLDNNGEFSQKDNLKDPNQSPYWQKFYNLTSEAIASYPEWGKKQKKIQITSNLRSWLIETLGATTREAEIIKNVLADFYKELN